MKTPKSPAADAPRGRRNFLRQSIAIVPLSALAACESRTGTPSAPQSAALSAAPPSTAKPRFFTEEEWAFVRAACDRLIPEDETGPGALSLDVPVFIDRQLEGEFGHAARWYMQGPFFEAPATLGYQSKLTPRESYRLGIAAVDAHCKTHYGKRFADTSHEQQENVLFALEGGKLTFEQVSGRDFFNFLLENTREGYLADPMYGGNRNMGSWKMIGFPGARADYADWVSRHGEAYPLGPVSVEGQQG
ncbi:gluconate 2-dehydrogenase subunit 3 family protein [uncultured Ralstonia sp.]|jgi:gluconate 2-dehydrogenase gamma chain|nr:gluconate 2-dehydrogenase subunit 3 family protein [uncultured Ralstonia sp.]